MKQILSILVGLSIAFFGAFSYAYAQSNEADENEDGYISTAEGIPFYGSVQASLTTDGDKSPDSALALDRFPTADDRGDIDYDETFEVSDDVIDALEDENAAIVLHGIDINESGEYDGAKESSLDEDVPFEATVPAACGIVEEDNNDEYEADLEELNSSNVNGNVEIEIEDDNEVRVMIDAEDLSPNFPHAQHIHFGTDGECPPNTDGVDQDITDDQMVGLMQIDVQGDDAENLESGDTRDYMVEGLDDDTSYRVTLVSTDMIEDDGMTFMDGDDENMAADPGSLDSTITAVNGDDMDGAQTQPGTDADAGTNGINPEDGEITFEVTAGMSSEVFVPVVYENPGNGPTTLLDLDDDDMPIDVYGIGGEITVGDEEVTDEELQDRIDLLREKIQAFTTDLTNYINSLGK